MKMCLKLTVVRGCETQLEHVVPGPCSTLQPPGLPAARLEKTVLHPLLQPSPALHSLFHTLVSANCFLRTICSLQAAHNQVYPGGTEGEPERVLHVEIP